MKEYTKPTLGKRPYHYVSHQPPFRQDSQPSSSGRGHQSHQNQGLVPRDGQIFIPREEKVNWNHNPHVTPTSSIRLKPKTPDILNLTDYQKVHSFAKALFKEIRETFHLAGRLKYLLKNWEKVTNDSASNPKYIQGLFYRHCGDSLQTKNTNKIKIKPI